MSAAYKLWDIAGVDGLAVAQALFGEAVGYLAPFQSLEAAVAGQDCSVLRLCDRNFRIAYPGPLDSLVAPLQARVWVRAYDWLSVVAIAPHQFSRLTAQATVRAPHRLQNLPNHQAVPAQVADIALVIWRHAPRGVPVVDLHLARTEVDRLVETVGLKAALA